VHVQLQDRLTFLVGENGSGKATLLEAIAARCAIRPGDGRSYAETVNEREETALSVGCRGQISGTPAEGLVPAG
jgi:predicted ATPase